MPVVAVPAVIVISWSVLAASTVLAGRSVSCQWWLECLASGLLCALLSTCVDLYSAQHISLAAWLASDSVLLCCRSVQFGAFFAQHTRSGVLSSLSWQAMFSCAQHVCLVVLCSAHVYSSAHVLSVFRTLCGWPNSKQPAHAVLPPSADACAGPTAIEFFSNARRTCFAG